MKCVALAGLIATGLTLSPASVKASPIAPAGIAPALDRDLVQEVDWRSDVIWTSQTGSGQVAIGTVAGGPRLIVSVRF
jgi:hypothetical protein